MCAVWLESFDNCINMQILKFFIEKTKLNVFGLKIRTLYETGFHILYTDSLKK